MHNFANEVEARDIVNKLYPNARKISVVDHGYDNLVVLVDEKCAIRFPRNESAYARSKYEKIILNQLDSFEEVAIPKVLSEYHEDPPYLVTTFLPGDHIRSLEINEFALPLRQELGERVARFAFALHSSLSVQEVVMYREQLKLDDQSEEPWEIYFEKTIGKYQFPSQEQDYIAKESYEKWKKFFVITNHKVVVHDDLHTDNLLFKDGHLIGILDFGDTNIGTPEEELRQLYRMSETILNAAVEEYQKLSGQTLNIEFIKLWAIVQELAVYSEQLSKGESKSPSYLRAARNLNRWFKTDIWGSNGVENASVNAQ